jgi:hypothetical protein
VVDIAGTPRAQGRFDTHPLLSKPVGVSVNAGDLPIACTVVRRCEAPCLRSCRQGGHFLGGCP